MPTSSPNISAYPSAPRTLKILMLHGYTQSGPLFHAKTRALEKALHKAFPPHPSPPTDKSLTPGALPSYPGGISLIYPSGPRKLRPADIPGFTASSLDADSDTEVPDCRAWWQRNDRTSEYTGMEEGFATIAQAIRDAGGIDGVIGFSQGAAAAAMVASLLDEGRSAAFAAEASQDGVRYPPAFKYLTMEPAQTSAGDGGDRESFQCQGPLKFAVSYSGFRAPDPLYSAFYTPEITTPMLHFIGSLDSVVDEGRSLALAECCQKRSVVYHPGGHFVPIGKDMVGALVGFIRECCGKKVVQEMKAEDIDLPF